MLIFLFYKNYLKVRSGLLTIMMSKAEIIKRIMLDIGVIISVGLSIFFMFLRFRLYNGNYSWGTGIFIVISLLLSMRRLKQPRVEPRPENTKQIMFQNIDTYVSIENRKALKGTEDLMLRAVISVVFIAFIPIDLILQIIKLAKSNVSENITK